MNVCLFDIDGTLINSGGAGKAAMEAALRAEFGLSELRDGVPFSGRTDRAIGRDLFRLHGLVDGDDAWRRFVASYLHHLPDTLRRHPGRVLPGISGALKRLQDRGDIACGLLTGNFREGARIKLDHFGLNDHFSFGGFGDRHLDRDDVARDALRAAAEHLCAAPPCERIVVVGDTPLDVRCARAVGARVVAVATGWHAYEELKAAGPDLLVRDLSDAEPLLALWD